MEQKAKWDWNIAAILGATFCFIGIVYLGICIPLFLDPADSDATIVRAIFLPIGLVFFLTGVILLTRTAAKKHRADQLIADGRYIWATVAALREIRNVNGFRGHPCVIQASYTDAYGQTYQFQSRYIYRKPNASIVGKPVKVYIQGGNYSTYYMDPEPLLQQYSTK